MPAPDALPPWPKSSPGRLTELERFIAIARQPPTAAEVGAGFSDTVPHELEETLQLLVDLDRIALIEGRYHWQG